MLCGAGTGGFGMSPMTEQTGLDDRHRNSLLSFYSAALTSMIAIGLTSTTPVLRIALLVLGTVAAAVAVWFLLRFLQFNDKRERQINYRALTFNFCGTLIFSLVVGLFQSAGFHSISWLGIPILMLILWSIGLICIPGGTDEDPATRVESGKRMVASGACRPRRSRSRHNQRH